MMGHQWIFQKAFNKVSPQRSLLKLKAHGIGNYVINWTEKWLTDRRQRVMGIHPVRDLEDDISSKVLKFAYDTKVFRKVKNDTDKQTLQDDLDKLVKWSEKW